MSEVSITIRLTASEFHQLRRELQQRDKDMRYTLQKGDYAQGDKSSIMRRLKETQALLETLG